MSIPNDSWLPLPEEPLFVLAMDHRGSSAKALPGSASAQPHIGLSRMRQVKALVYEGLCHIAGSIPVGREGVLADGASGADVLRRAKSDGLVVLMPIEAPGSRVFELEHHDRFAEHIEAFDPDFLNALVRYNPLDDEGMRHTTIDASRRRCPNGRRARTGAGSLSCSSHPRPGSRQLIKTGTTSRARRDPH